MNDLLKEIWKLTKIHTISKSSSAERRSDTYIQPL